MTPAEKAERIAQAQARAAEIRAQAEGLDPLSNAGKQCAQRAADALRAVEFLLAFEAPDGAAGTPRAPSRQVLDVRAAR